MLSADANGHAVDDAVAPSSADNETMIAGPVDPIAPISCANIRCRGGYKCVMVEPANCYGCRLRPRCVQTQCDTTCRCNKFQYCVLVSTDCCPVPSCRYRFEIADPVDREPMTS
ncbi:hypothetical protein Q1695_002183 [Nippostrongylus brasiliensis]|nr:hypothetical protein Q1695_002183 [Nippostrongylus brasiliensis]